VGVGCDFDDRHHDGTWNAAGLEGGDSVVGPAAENPFLHDGVDLADVFEAVAMGPEARVRDDDLKRFGSRPNGLARSYKVTAAPADIMTEFGRFAADKLKVRKTVYIFNRDNDGFVAQKNWFETS
jgi:hypothetical protein